MAVVAAAGKLAAPDRLAGRRGVAADSWGVAAVEHTPDRPHSRVVVAAVAAAAVGPARTCGVPQGEGQHSPLAVAAAADKLAAGAEVQGGQSSGAGRARVVRVGEERLHLQQQQVQGGHTPQPGPVGRAQQEHRMAKFRGIDGYAKTLYHKLALK